MIRLDLAACRDGEPELFDPPADDLESIDAARAICAHCAIRLDCLALAFADPDATGIWGGLTREQRMATRGAGIGPEVLLSGRVCERPDDALPESVGSPSDGREARDESTDCVMGHLFAMGLSLTGVIQDRNVDAGVAERVRDALAEIDAAAGEIRRRAFALLMLGRATRT